MTDINRIAESCIPGTTPIITGVRHIIKKADFRRFPDEEALKNTYIDKNGERVLKPQFAKKIEFRIKNNIIPNIAEESTA